MSDDITPDQEWEALCAAMGWTKEPPAMHYEYPIPMPGETYDAYVDRAATAYVELHRADGWPENECQAMHESFVWREKAITAAQIEHMVKSNKIDDRRLYLWPKMYYNYTTLVPLDYKVTADNLQEAEIKLAAMIAEHNAQEAMRERRKNKGDDRGWLCCEGIELILHMPHDPRVVAAGDREKRRNELFALRAEAAGDPVKQAAISAEINALADPCKELEAENAKAMKKRKLEAEECIKWLKNEIRLAKTRHHYDKDAQILDEKAERRRATAEKDARLAEQRAERSRILAEKEARIAAKEAERLRLVQQREATKAEYNRLIAAQIEQKRLEKEQKELEQAKRLQKELKQQAAKIKNLKKSNI